MLWGIIIVTAIKADVAVCNAAEVCRDAACSPLAMTLQLMVQNHSTCLVILLAGEAYSH